MSTQTSIKKNTVYNVIKTLSSIAFPLISFQYITRVLGAENVGKVNFAASIISYISLIASLGISTYAIRECSKVRDKKDELNKISSQIFSLNLLSTLFAYFVLLIMIILWNKVDGYKELILIQSINVVFATLGADWINSAMEDFKYITIRTFIFQVLSLALMFIFVRSAKDYITYAVIMVISASGGNLLNIFYRKKYCDIKITKNIEAKKHIKPIFFLFAMLLAQTIYVNVDTTMLGVMRTDVEVGWYSTATKIYTMVNQVIASIAFVVMPQISYFYEEKNYKEINRLLKYAFNFIIVLGIPSLVGLFTLAPEIIEVVGGPEYLPATLSLRILTVALAFSLLGGWIGNIIFLPSGREKICLYVCVLSALINFVANIFLIPKWGINAAAFTTALSQFIAFAVSVPFIEKEVDIGNIFKLTSAPVVGGIFVGLVVTMVKAFIANLWIKTLTAILLSVIVYVLVMVVMKNEFVVNILNSVLNKIGIKGKR